MADVATLKRQRSTLRAKATRFKTYIEKYVPNADTVFELESRIEKFNLLWSEFDHIQDEIDEQLQEPETAERDMFENAFFATLTLAKKKKAEIQNQTRTVPVGSGSNTVTNIDRGSGAVLSSARLPMITLLNFDGSYERWQSFFDIFSAMVDRNNSLDTVTKFHYLQSALTGKATDYINSFEITDANYSIVLELLKKRYHNSRLVINHHVQQLFSRPSVTRDSAGSLRALSDGLQKHTRILEQLKEPVKEWDTLLIYLASTRLDNVTKREWELKVVSEKLDKLSQFIDFLEVRCQMLEAVSSNSNGTNNLSGLKSTQFNKRETKTLTHFAAGDVSSECAICRDNHRIYSCTKFRNLSVEEKRNKVRELNLCFNCLGNKHTARDCKSIRFCKTCSGKHHSLLHIDRSGLTNSNNIDLNNQNCEKNTAQNALSTSITMFAYRDRSEKLLSTAIVYIKNNVGELVEARALLDSGSMSNFMTKNLCRRLRLRENVTSHVISGVDLTETAISSRTATSIQSMQNAYKIRADFLVINDISNCIPMKRINKSEILIPEHIVLADPDFNIPNPVDLLLGTAIFWDSLEPEQIKQGQTHPVLQRTKFGWILGGHLTRVEAAGQLKSQTKFCGFISNATLNDQLERFWKINEEKTTAPKSALELDCEKMFSDTYTRTSDGRFQVDMLLKINPDELGESHSNAKRRLMAMERRFNNDSVMKERYHAFLDEYIT